MKRIGFSPISSRITMQQYMEKESDELSFFIFKKTFEDYSITTLLPAASVTEISAASL